MRIKDVAEAAHVSPSTVSRYLNGHYEAMSDETRERIAGVIERTGYQPSNVARSLRTDRSYTLGVVIADLRNPYSAAMLGELDAQAARRGYSLVTATSDNDPGREAAAVRRLVATGVDGLVVNTCDEDPDALLEACGSTPAVLLDRDTSPSVLPLVTSNNAQLISALVDELRAARCARLLLVTEADATSSVRRARADAFVSALAERGLDGGVVAIDRAEGAGSLGELGRELAEGRQLGVIAVNGLVFLRVVEMVGELGLDVPRDVRLATFDDYAWNHVLYGGVTTAVQNTRRIAGEVLDLVLDPGHTDVPPVRVEVPGSLIERASTRTSSRRGTGTRGNA